MAGPSQSRATSFAEALANVTVGYLLALATQQLLFPLFGFEASLAEHGAIAAVFTLISLCRSYLLRRLFTQVEQLRAIEREQKASSLSRRLARTPGACRTSTYRGGL